MDSQQLIDLTNKLDLSFSKKELLTNKEEFFSKLRQIGPVTMRVGCLEFELSTDLVNQLLEGAKEELSNFKEKEETECIIDDVSD